METILIGMVVALTLLTGSLGAWALWRRWYRRCVTCASVMRRRYPHCPWCGQRQFHKTGKPSTPVSAVPQRRRASMPTGERLALLISRKKKAPSTVILAPERSAAKPVRTSGRDQTTIRTSALQTARCAHCGTRIEGIETFCGHCGQSVR